MTWIGIIGVVSATVGIVAGVFTILRRLKQISSPIEVHAWSSVAVDDIAYIRVRITNTSAQDTQIESALYHYSPKGVETHGTYEIQYFTGEAANGHAKARGFLEGKVIKAGNFIDGCIVKDFSDYVQKGTVGDDNEDGEPWEYVDESGTPQPRRLIEIGTTIGGASFVIEAPMGIPKYEDEGY